MQFALTYDYRCPFAHLAHDHVLVALEEEPGWDVRFVPFSLGQAHVEEGEPDIWERPEDDSGLLALRTSVVVRDAHPAAFPDVHRDVFDLRHVEGRALGTAELGEVVARHGLDAPDVLARAAAPGTLDQVQKEHESMVTGHEVWGVPTFVLGERAAFVRLMDPPTDPATARRDVERILDLLGGWPSLNEFKHTSLSR
jgi:2-hydroxychromene-2-carboxylate isomerase